MTKKIIAMLLAITLVASHISVLSAAMQFPDAPHPQDEITTPGSIFGQMPGSLTTPGVFLPIPRAYPSGPTPTATRVVFIDGAPYVEWDNISLISYNPDDEEPTYRLIPFDGKMYITYNNGNHKNCTDYTLNHQIQFHSATPRNDGLVSLIVNTVGNPYEYLTMGTGPSFLLYNGYGRASMTLHHGNETRQIGLTINDFYGISARSWNISPLEGYNTFVNSGGWMEFHIDGQTNASMNGVYYHMFIAKDANFKDAVPPTTPTITKFPEGTWSGSTVTATIGGSTDPGGSGINKYQYQINGGGWADYAAPIPFEYSATIEARAIDNAGNMSSVSTIQINIDKTAPTAPIVTKSPAGEYSGTDVTAAIGGSTDTGGSGVQLYQYQINGGSWITYTAPVVIADNATLGARALDSVSNISPVTVEQIKIDRIAPTVPAITKSPNTEYSGSNVTVSIAGSTDAGGSGLKGYEYQLNGGAWTAYTVPVVVSANTTVTARALDNVGNSSPVASAQIKIDKIAPTIPIITKSPADEYSGVDVTISISGSTDAGGSGLKNYEYQLNGGAWQAYNTPFVVTDNTTVTARALDNVGNVSPIAAEQVKIDKIVPTIPIITKSPADEYSGVDVTISIDGSTDVGGSGLKGYEYQLDGGTWQPYTAPFVLSSTATVRVRALDNVGNTSTMALAQVKIDKVAPTAPMIIATPDLPWNINPVDMSIADGTDTESGIQKSQYQLDAGPWTDYASPVEVTTTTAIAARTIDNVGNVSDVTTKDIIFDKVNPMITSIKFKKTDNALQRLFSGLFDNKQLIFEVFAADDASGIAEIQYQTVTENSEPGSSWQTYNATKPPKIDKAFTGKVCARAIDVAGNISDVFSSDVVIVEDTAPIAGHTLSPDGWTNHSVEIDLLAEDIESGVKSIILPDLQVVHTTGAAVYIAPKNDTYHFTVLDNAGNVLDYPVVVDKIEDVLPTPPKEEIIDEDGNVIPPEAPDEPELIEKDWTNSEIDLETKSDAPSGIKTYEYKEVQPVPEVLRYQAGRMVDTDWIEFDGSLKLAAEGVKTVLVRSISNAGNVSIPSQYTVKTDYTPPTATHEVSVGKIIVTAEDNLSGIKSIGCEHGVTNGNVAECAASPQHDYLITDNAGNTATYTVTIIQGGGSGGGDGDGGEDYPRPQPKPTPPTEPKPVPPAPPVPKVEPPKITVPPIVTEIEPVKDKDHRKTIPKETGKTVEITPEPVDTDADNIFNIYQILQLFIIVFLILILAWYTLMIIVLSDDDIDTPSSLKTAYTDT